MQQDIWDSLTLPDDMSEEKREFLYLFFVLLW